MFALKGLKNDFQAALKGIDQDFVDEVIKGSKSDSLKHDVKVEETKTYEEIKVIFYQRRNTGM